MRPGYTPSNPIRLAINIGACLDIPTGSWIKGRKGEMVCNGGLYPSTAFVAGGNAFKSTTMMYAMYTACLRLDYGSIDTSMSIYETEMNAVIARLIALSHNYGFPLDRDIINEGKLVVTDKSKDWADGFHAKYKDFIAAKIKDGTTVATPFYCNDKTTPYRVLPISLTAYDSASEIETSHATTLRDKSSLGDSDQQTMHMKQGLIKYNMFMELPVLINNGMDYLAMTGQYKQDTIQMASGPHQAPPPKRTPDMKGGERIKGVPDKFYYLLNNCWYIKSLSNMYANDTRANKYPASADDDQEDNDLKLLTVINLRGKGGPSGVPVYIVVSQREGVLASMTEFYHIKEVAKNFGISGNNIHYSLDLLPDVKLSRTTIRPKLANDPRLARAINITSELLQMINMMPEYGPYYCTPKQLYDDIKALGYDWEFILSNTRGWYTLNECYDTPLKFLSTFDLLRMRKGEYKPYWME